jgi:hypothetical protein
MRYVSVLVHNSVPLIGVLVFEWPVLNLLALFWFDALMNAGFDSARIAVHRRMTKDPAHRTGIPDYSGRRFAFVGTAAGRGTYLQQQARSAYPVIALCGAGLLITHLVLARIGIQHDFDPLDFVHGAAMISAIAAIEFVIDLRTLHTRSFLWLQHRAGSLAIGLLVAALLVGIPVVFWFQTLTAAYVVLVLLKTAADCAGVMYDEQKARLWPAGWDRI